MRMHFLNNRFVLSGKEKQHYLNLKKGYEGECKFDLLAEEYCSNCYVLNDLLLKVNNTTCQIDSLHISSDTIFIYEIKNFEGDFFYESDRFYKLPDKEYTNPLFQLKRSESLINQLLKRLDCHLPVVAKVVFINPAFTLYQAPLDKPFLFPTQLNNYFNLLHSKLNKLTELHEKIASQLLSWHIEESPFTLTPNYQFDQLRKGIYCESCNSFSVVIHGKKCMCLDCNHEELVSSAIARHVQEFKILFPNKKITTNVIYDWLKIVQSKKRIRIILNKQFNKIGIRQWTYYE